jgi:anaerobic selenocysteine-containing dehydrogenase
VTGTLTHWLINALNVVTGNFDTPGGAMFSTPAIDILRLTELALKQQSSDRQRVSDLPAFIDERPVAGLADEMLTPGDGQVRAMVSYAGNPVLSTPGGARLDEALARLDWFVAVDMYVTETTRHAHVILPPVSHLERDDIDMVLSSVAVHNYIRYNPAALPAPPDGRTDWQILMALAARVARGAQGGAMRLLQRFSSPDRILDAAMRAGPHGLGRGGLSIAKLKAAAHGIDLGPLEPRAPGVLRTKGKRVQLAPAEFIAEAGQLDRLAAERDAALSNGYDLVLIGRRQLRSNNSWMHNSARLMKGSDRCTALLHPDDAVARGLSDGQRVHVSSAVGTIELPIEVSDEIRPGVVSIPHGFGHNRSGVGWRRAAAKPGASMNDITDPAVVDRLTGNAAFNSVPVRVEALPAAVMA